MLDIKVTNINGVYHARLLNDDKVIDEMACKNKCDIGWICREMIRWQAKLGSTDPIAWSARKRQENSKPKGFIKYLNTKED